VDLGSRLGSKSLGENRQLLLRQTRLTGGRQLSNIPDMEAVWLQTRQKRILALCAHLHEDRAAKQDHEWLQPMARPARRLAY
jgi:hypothetical protein